MVKNSLHTKELEEIRRKLSEIGWKESHFISVELLFYQSITIARNIGSDPSTNELLAALKQLEANEYKTTKEFYRRSTQKEQAIRRFVMDLKTIFAAAIKNYSGKPLS
jgi:hypothetical protein